MFRGSVGLKLVPEVIHVIDDVKKVGEKLIPESQSQNGKMVPPLLICVIHN